MPKRLEVDLDRVHAVLSNGEWTEVKLQSGAICTQLLFCDGITCQPTPVPAIRFRTHNDSEYVYFRYDRIDAVKVIDETIP